MIFKAWENSTLLVKVWNSCPANCPGCTVERNKSYVKYDDFFNTLLIIKEKFDKSFSVFLFWICFSSNKDIEKYIDFFQKHQYNNIVLHINPFFDNNTFNLMKIIAEKYSNISFDFIFYIRDNSDIKSLLTFLKICKNYNKRRNLRRTWN